ncbi:MAG: murein hydrolase activator EnvC family protein [Wolinella sp.]
MRFIWICTLAFATFCHGESIHTQIKEKNSELKSNIQKERKISQKLETLGDEVNKRNQKIVALDKDISLANENIAKNEGEFREREKELLRLEKNLSDIERDKKEIERQILEAVAQDVSFVMVLNQHQPKSAEELIFEEVFKTLSSEMKKRVDSLGVKQAGLLRESEAIKGSIVNIKKFISAENQKRARLDEMRKKQKEHVASLDKEMKNYDAELKLVVQERDSLKELLKQLNITKEEEEDKERQEAQRRKESQKQATADGKSGESLNVRQMASSYQNVRTVKYVGEKTIPPLEKYEIARRFGPYFDPVYKMKVFNESVIFSALSSDTKVRSVLDGRVVFAKEMPVLKRVVIIEHKNGLHTIYAHLDKIAPTIKPGISVKKGYTIGRIDTQLMFEVTQKDSHINPLELITAK